MEKSLTPLSVRQKLGLTQVEMAKLLDVTSEYLSMVETGKRNLSKKLLRKFESLHGAPPPAENHAVVQETHSKYECRIPANCDLPAQLDSVRAELHDLKGKMDTLLGLLGGPLRSAVGLERDDKDRAG